MCKREEGCEVIKEEKMRDSCCGKVSSRAMDCKRQAVQIPLSAPPFKLQKLILEIFAGKAENASVPHIPYFIYGPLESIVYRVSWLGTFMRYALKNLSLGRYA